MGIKYAILAYDTSNIGDEIQSLAAAQFLPRIDTYINREWLNRFSPPPGDEYMLIMNGWYCHLPENWPPSSAIRPLLISMHLTGQKSDSGYIPSNHLLAGNNRSYLVQHAPVGARDLPTLHHLQAAGIPSYFSGCLTLTLRRPSVTTDQTLLLLNDVPIKVEQLVRSCSSKRIEKVSQITTQRNSAKRFQAACDLLDKYAAASLVVTSRLHCALPCLAFGTPVILVTSAEDKTRFQGLDDWLTHFSVDQFCSKFKRSMIDQFESSCTKHLTIRDSLVQAVTGFVDCDFYDKFDGDYRHLVSHGAIADGQTDLHNTILSIFYRQILGREADGDGLSYYTRLIQSRGVEEGIDFILGDMLASQESTWQKRNG